MIDSDAELTLSNLKILGRLSHNDKLITSESIFDIHPPSTWRAIYRSFYGERRGMNIQRVKFVVRSGKMYITSLGNAIQSMPDTDASRSHIQSHLLHHSRFIDGMKSAQNGIRNLVVTYGEDAASKTQLSTLVDEIDDFLRVTEYLLPRLPSYLETSSSYGKPSSPSERGGCAYKSRSESPLALPQSREKRESPGSGSPTSA